MPEVIFNFKSDDESIITKLNEGIDIGLQMGRTVEDMKDINISVSKFRSVNHGDSSLYYETKGFAGPPKYLINKNYLLSDKKSAIEVAQDTLSNYFTVESEVQKSKDKQVWIQPSCVDKKFVNELLMKADLGDSSPIYGITADGKFIMKDIAKLIQQDYKWRFTREPIEEERDIQYTSDPILDSISGFINNWVGYGRTINSFNMISGDLVPVSQLPETILSMSSELDKASGVDAKFAGQELQSDNTHANYWSAYTKNILALAILSRIEVAITIPNIYVDIKPCDLVMYSQGANDNPEQSSEYTSGYYIVSKVIRTIQENQMANYRITE